MNAFEKSLAERLGTARLEKIQSIRVGIAGAGGLGSNCAAYLARSGFRHFTLADSDSLDSSNLNRQFFFAAQVGQAKVEALKANLLAINFDLDIETHMLRLEPQNLQAVFAQCQAVVEAFDTVAGKKMMAETFWPSDKLLVSASGLGGWGNADFIRVHRVAKNFFLVGDLNTGVSPEIPPMAPRVNVAAAKQADIILAWALEGDYQTPTFAQKAARLATDLYGITSEEHSRGRSHADVARQMIVAGIRIIQYREKNKSLKEKVAECHVLRELTRNAGVVFIVNDEVAIAQLVDADGVHLGQDDLPVEAARSLLGPEKFIGVSTHSPEQLQAAIAGGADYAGVGPIYPTSTKTGVCAPVGLGYIDYARQHATLPWVAIGGIKEHNLAEVASHGATCAALVTEIVGAPDIPIKIAALRAIMQKNRPRP